VLLTITLLATKYLYLHQLCWTLLVDCLGRWGHGDWRMKWMMSFGLDLGKEIVETKIFGCHWAFSWTTIWTWQFRASFMKVLTTTPRCICFYNFLAHIQAKAQHLLLSSITMSLSPKASTCKTNTINKDEELQLPSLYKFTVCIEWYGCLQYSLQTSCPLVGGWQQLTIVSSVFKVLITYIPTILEIYYSIQSNAMCTHWFSKSTLL